MAFESLADVTGYGGAAGGGKGLALDTPIPTPSGWTTMGALRVGDVVFAADGSQCLVVGVTEPTMRKCYRLTFDDGSELVADDVHRWVTLSAQERAQFTRKQEGTMRSTEEIAATVRDGERANHSIGSRYIVSCEQIDVRPNTLHRRRFRIQAVPCREVDDPDAQHRPFGRAVADPAPEGGIFRQNGTELVGVIDRIGEILKTRDGYNGKDHIWRFQRPDGTPVQIEFGSFPTPGEEKKYQGRPHDLLIFDEASNMRMEAVRFLLGWLRTDRPEAEMPGVVHVQPADHGRRPMGGGLLWPVAEQEVSKAGAGWRTAVVRGGGRQGDRGRERQAVHGWRREDLLRSPGRSSPAGSRTTPTC
jgi:hypothetical protein